MQQHAWPRLQILAALAQAEARWAGDINLLLSVCGVWRCRRPDNAGLSAKFTSSDMDVSPSPAPASPSPLLSDPLVTALSDDVGLSFWGSSSSSGLPFNLCAFFDSGAGGCLCLRFGIAVHRRSCYRIDVQLQRSSETSSSAAASHLTSEGQHSAVALPPATGQAGMQRMQAGYVTGRSIHVAIHLCGLPTDLLHCNDQEIRHVSSHISDAESHRSSLRVLLPVVIGGPVPYSEKLCALHFSDPQPHKLHCVSKHSGPRSSRPTPPANAALPGCAPLRLILVADQTKVHSKPLFAVP